MTKVEQKFLETTDYSTEIRTGNISKDGSLTIKDGVDFLFLVPTDYLPTK